MNGQRFYCAEYSRMKRRNCHAVLYSEDQFGLIQCFVLVLQTNFVYALIKKMNTCNDSWLCTYEGAKQLQSAVVTNSMNFESVENLKSTLLFIELESTHKAILVNTPNNHGHAILK